MNVKGDVPLIVDGGRTEGVDDENGADDEFGQNVYLTGIEARSGAGHDDASLYRKRTDSGHLYHLPHSGRPLPSPCRHQDATSCRSRRRIPRNGRVDLDGIVSFYNGSSSAKAGLISRIHHGRRAIDGEDLEDRAERQSQSSEEVDEEKELTLGDLHFIRSRV